MLSFHFTGVEGRMTQSEILTSGMVGKEVQILFDESWTTLSRTVVFRAGDVCRTVQNLTPSVVIPEDVLARPFCKLYVGLYGTDITGTVVIPTVMAEGPMIHYGADPTEDPKGEDLPVWKKLQEQIGNLSELDTESQGSLVAAVNENHRNLELLAQESDRRQAQLGQLSDLETDAKDSLVAAVNELHAELQQPGSAGTGLSEAAAALLVEILRHAIYEDHQAGNIDALAAELGLSAGDPGDDVTPEEPVVTMNGLSVSYAGGDVPVGTALTDLAGITVTAHYSDGSSQAVTDYTLSGTIAEGSNTVTVTYAGKTAAFAVTGLAGETPTDMITGITVDYTGGDVPVGTVVTDLIGITVTAHYSDGYSKTINLYDLSGQIAEGENTITVTYEGQTATFTVVGVAAAADVDQTETLEMVYTTSYPNVTTFAYTEQASAGNYAVAKRGNLGGGVLSVDFDPTIINWNLNLYVFDADGNPYCQTDKAFTTLRHPTYNLDVRWGGDMDNDYVPGSAFEWTAVGAGAGFGTVIAPFTIQLPAGCTCIACIRTGSSGVSDFTTWAKNGGITFTVTTHK